MTGICITVTRTAGSTPRDAGTQMMVWADRTTGTIGGGALEWAAMARARQMLAQGEDHVEETVALGPSLGQCCGGSVSLRYTAATAMHDNPQTPLWIYGAGHVGRAVVAVMSALPDWAITWVDTQASRFPAIPDGVTQLIAAEPARVVPHAPPNAHHLILTYSHDIDLALCHAVLQRDFAAVGLIGSATKWARFRSRLAALGHDSATIARIACPIGDPALGKHPQALAIGIAHAMISAGQSAALGDKAG